MFLSDGGSPIPSTIDLVDQESSVFQVDLKIDSGRILVRDPGELDVTETFVIDATFAPSTRGVSSIPTARRQHGQIFGYLISVE